MSLSSGEVTTRWRRGRRDRRLGAAWLSVGAHVVVLSVLASRIPLRQVEDAVQTPALAVNVVMDRRLAEERIAAPSRVAPPVRVQARSAQPSLRLRPLERSDGASNSAVATGAGDAVGDPAAANAGRAGVGEGRLPAAEMQPDLRGLLRATVGCSHQEYLQLSGDERRRCDARFGDASALKAGDFIADAKRGAYGVEAAAGQRRLQRRAGALPQPIIACDGPGSHLGAPCLPDDALHSIKPH